MDQRKTAITYGIGASLIMISGWIISNSLFIDESGNWDFGKSEIAGYIAMILSLSTIIIGVKRYRDNVKNGFISFKEAFLTGLYIVIIASVIYVIGWMIYYPFIATEFCEQYLDHSINEWHESGLSQSEISENKSAMIAQFEAYENPIIRIGMTFLEIFPIGLVIALISALILKKKEKS